MNLNLIHVQRCALYKKIRLLTRLTIILILLGLLQVSAVSMAQSISLSRKNAPLEKVLNDIKKQSGYDIIYIRQVISKSRPVNIQVENKPLEETLKIIFADQPLDFKIYNRTIVISERTSQASTFFAPVLNKNIDVKGKVVDETGQPMPGVSIKVKGGSNGSVTDPNGLFTLKNIDEDAILIVSYVGYDTQELKATASLTVSLKPASSSLSDVVVVGYGTQKKVNLSGAVSTVSGAELTKRVATNPSQLLQGQLAGVNVTQGSGEAGNENTNITIRGLGTYSGAGSQPLYIIDGIPGNFSNLNPENIENVTVLKDAASAAIYGSRGANGVILVTTKQGKAGKTQISYSYNIGVTNATRLPELIWDSPTYMRLFNQAANNSGLAAASRFTPQQIDAYTNPANPNQYPSFNWLDAVFQSANVHTHNLSVTGGSEKTTYNVGLGFVDQPDVMAGFSFKKTNLQFNINSTISDHIKMGTNLTINYGRRIFPRNGSEDQFLSTLAQSPLYAPTLPDGSGRYTAVAYPFMESNKNPIAVAETALASTDNYAVQGNLFVDVKLLEGLQWRTTLGTNFNFSKNYEYKPVVNQYYYQSGLFARTLDVAGQGLTVTDNNDVYPLGISQLTYNKKIGAHNFSALAGVQKEYFKEQNLSASRVYFASDGIREINAGGAGNSTNSGYANEWSLSSYFGRINYDYKGKYLFEASARYDGSSRFKESTRWGFFPSASVAYRISQEKFFENLLPVINDLKFRASYGVLGNQNIAGNINAKYYPYQTVYNTGFPYPLGSSLVDGVRQNALADDLITWETTASTNFGIDIVLLKNKLNLTVDYYNRNTKDILDAAVLPIYTGTTAPTVNFGKLANKGLDLSVSYKNRVGDFAYGVQGIFQTNKNKVTEYGATSISARNIRQAGLPYDSYYLYEFEKIFQSAAEVSSSAVQSPAGQPGLFKFKDLNGDNKIDANDRRVFDGIFPKFDYSFKMDFEYKNFDLSIFLYGSEGRKVYVNQWGMEPFRQGSPPPVEWVDAWTAEKPSTTLPLIYIANSGPIAQNLGAASSYYLKDASFLRIKNIQLGYNFPTSLTRKFFVNALRVYFAGDNLFLFSKFPGLDPERAVNATSDRYVTHPQNKVFNFGLRVTL